VKKTQKSKNLKELKQTKKIMNNLGYLIILAFLKKKDPKATNILSKSN